MSPPPTSEKKAAAQPEIDALTSGNAELEEKIDQLNKKQAIMKHETNELKTANSTARDELV